MAARRIVAVSADKAFGKQLAMALKVAGGVVEAYPSLDALGAAELQSALWVIDLAHGLGPGAEPEHIARAFLPRLGSEARAIVVLPRAHLASVVDVMQASGRVAAVMIAEDFDPSALSAMARRILTGDVFGLEKLVMWGVQIHSQLVSDYHEKSLCMAQIAEFAELVGVPRPHRAAIEQCIDEMLMNALYDAPVDQDGKPIFQDVPTRTRIALRTEQVVVVQYAFDGRRFAVSVRDAFGSLERDTVLRVLDKCLHAEQPVDRRAGGAGVGLYLMASSASTVHFHIAPGIATEAVCVFDLEAPQPQLQQFGFFVEQLDAAGGAAGGAADGSADGAADGLAGPARQFSAGALRAIDRSAPPPGRFITIGLAVAIAATVVLIGVAAWPRVFGVRRAEVAFTTIPAGAAIEIDGRIVGTAASGTLRVDHLAIGHPYAVVARLAGYQPKQIVVQPRAGANAVTLELAPQTAIVDLDSEPGGASVEVAGKSVGTTPLSVTSLPPGTEVAVVFKRTGYRDAAARLRVPALGEKTRLVQHLEVSDDVVRVHFVSDPPGARVVRLGQAESSADRTYTPAEVLVDAGHPQRFMLVMPNHVPLVIEPFTPTRDAGVIEKGGKLVEGATLHIEAAQAGKVTVAGAPHCADLAVPADCTLAPGSYTVDYVGPGTAHASRTVKLADQDATLRF